MNMEEGSQSNKLEVIVQLQRSLPIPPNPHDFTCFFTMQRQTDTVKILPMCMFHGLLLVRMERWMDGGWVEEEGKTSFLH